MSGVGERYTMRISRHDLSPYQYHLKEGDKVFIAVESRSYMLAVDSIAELPGEGAKITVSGILEHYSENSMKPTTKPVALSS